MGVEALFGSEKIGRILLKMAPPVMLAQLIQAMYNIVDSAFIGRYAESGLTALSIVYPLQLLMIALAVGTGVGANALISGRLGAGREQAADEAAGVAPLLAGGMWLLFAGLCFFLMPAYARMSSDSEAVIRDTIVYGRIVCVFSLGFFLESVWTKVIQARGDTRTPMIAQIAGALTNIVLDPLLIFGLCGCPELGIAGAAIATVIGQTVAALVVMKKGLHRPPERERIRGDAAEILRMGMPNILLQSAYTFYILGMNMILAGFCDEAVTALGLYYKLQSFFYIPLGALHTCMVPLVSFNYNREDFRRTKGTLRLTMVWAVLLMGAGNLIFELVPGFLIGIFSSDPLVLEIGRTCLRIIGMSFTPQAVCLTLTMFFQAVGWARESSWLAVIRNIFLFVPLAAVLSHFGLHYIWLSYPLTEIITTVFGLVYYRRFRRHLGALQAAV